MLLRRPTQFNKSTRQGDSDSVNNAVPRQTESVGLATLRLPHSQIWAKFVIRFAKQALAKLYDGQRVGDSKALLHDMQLSADAISLDEWFATTYPPKPPLEWSVTQIQELAKQAEDLAQPDGCWRDQLEDVELNGAEALSELSDRIRRVCEATTQDYGPRPARDLLKYLHRQLAAHRHRLAQRPNQWTNDRSGELQTCAERIRAMARPPKWHWKLLCRVRPSLSPKLWLSRGQQAILRGQLVGTIHQAVQLRFDEEINARKRWVLDRMLGQTDRAGILDNQESELRAYKRCLRKAAEALPADATSVRETTTDLLLVEDLDTVVDTNSGFRMVDLMDREVHKSGCCPQGLAEQWLRNGVSVKGINYLPGRWCDLPPARLARVLHRATLSYLGATDPQAALDLEKPRSAFEHASTITLVHPALRALLRRRIADLARKSAPFALFENITGAEPKIPAYLFCHPSQRASFEELLLSKAKLANRQRENSSVNRDYDLKSPYIVTLTQIAFAAPGGAQRDLQQAMMHVSLLRRRSKTPPLFDDCQYSEVRLLNERPHDITDARHLFDAGRRARFIISIGTGQQRFQLAKPDHRVQSLFVPLRLTRNWTTADSLSKLISSHTFVQFVPTLFPKLRDWANQAQQLSEHRDSEYVADRLVELGIFEAGMEGLYRIAALPPGDHNSLPAGLYHKQPGAVQGLSRQQFTKQLLANDWLYNIVFWQVADALHSGQLPPTEVPAFLAEYVKALR